MTNPLAPLKYGRVIGRFLANTADGPDLGDLPEFPPLTGRLTFTAEAPKILVATSDPPATYVQLPKHYVASLDEFGYLTWRGERGIRLVAPSPETNPNSWTWRVTFDLSYDGDSVPIAPFSFAVPEYIPGPDPEDPDEGAVGLVDLTLVSPVPSSTGNAVVRGVSVDSVELDENDLIFGLDDGTFLPPVTVPAIEEATDAATAAAASATAAASSATAAQNAVNSFDLDIGTVTEGPADATVSGGPPAWTLDLVLPPGPAGPAAPDATSSVKGIMRLNGILAGDANNPAFNAAAFGTSSTTACRGDDARLSDARTPTSHTHPASQISDSTSVGRSVLTAADAAAARTAISTIADNDSRLSDARTPTAAGQVYDFTIKSHAGARAAGAGNVIPEGVRVERAISISAITWRGETAGTGNLVVELRKNGSNTGMPAASTISAANHAADTVVTAGGPWSVAAGDRITVQIATADSPAGNGLQVSIKATTT